SSEHRPFPCQGKRPCCATPASILQTADSPIHRSESRPAIDGAAWAALYRVPRWDGGKMLTSSRTLRSVYLLLSFGFAFLSSGAAAWAQLGNAGSIEGVVKDPSGSAAYRQRDDVVWELRNRGSRLRPGLRESEMGELHRS